MGEDFYRNALEVPEFGSSLYLEETFDNRARVLLKESTLESPMEGAGEMAQGLKSLEALPEGLGSIPSAYMAVCS